MTINIEQLVTENNLTFEEAKELVGKESTQGKILGITGKPGLGYSEGVYLTCSKPNEQSKHFRIGNE